MLRYMVCLYSENYFNMKFCQNMKQVTELIENCDDKFSVFDMKLNRKLSGAKLLLASVGFGEQ